MLLSIPEPWQSVINFLSVALCVLTAWLLIRGHRNGKAPEKGQPVNASRSQATDFKDDVNLAILNQELNRSFSSLTEMLEKQHQYLSSLITRIEPGRPVAEQSPSRSPKEDGQDGPASRDTSADAQPRVMALHQQGVAPQEIASQLKIPRGEIELIIKMASAGTGDPDPSSTS